jgi:hypothetical protein
LVLGGVEEWPTLAVIPTCAMVIAANLNLNAIAAASSAWRMAGRRLSGRSFEKASTVSFKLKNTSGKIPRGR